VEVLMPERLRWAVRWTREGSNLGGYDLKDCAAALQDAIERLESHIYKLGVDTKMPEHRRRFWQRVPEYVDTARHINTDRIEWKIGFNDDAVTLLLALPYYTKAVTRSQSPLEYLRFGEPRSFTSNDQERQDRLARGVMEALATIGFHPGGPNPPVSIEPNGNY
jgi:hypothetical protein